MVMGTRVELCAGRHDVLELGRHEASARREGSVENRRADGEGVGTGFGQGANARRRIDAASDHEIAVHGAARGAHQLERVRLGRPVGQQVGARTAQLGKAPAVARHLFRAAAKLGGMTLGTAREGVASLWR